MPLKVQVAVDSALWSPLASDNSSAVLLADTARVPPFHTILAQGKFGSCISRPASAFTKEMSQSVGWRPPVLDTMPSVAKQRATKGSSRNY